MGVVWKRIAAEERVDIERVEVEKPELLWMRVICILHDSVPSCGCVE
jgi:hypothetical protein